MFILDPGCSVTSLQTEARHPNVITDTAPIMLLARGWSYATRRVIPHRIAPDFASDP